jgi:histone acetyltransferase (RNA polymerase elongator complex component)
VKIYPVFIPHAGCPHRCLFCAQDRIASQSAVPRAAEVAAWLEQILPPQGDGEIAFYGGTFSLLPVSRQEEYLAVAKPPVADGRVGGIRISTRPDALDANCLKRLKAAGVTTIEIGCQSFNAAVLMAANRGHTASECLSAIRRCRQAGVSVGVQLMPGLPGGDQQEALQSLRQALELKPTFVRIYPAVVIAGTGLAELWKTGCYQPWTLDQAVDICADMLQICHFAEMPVIRLGLQHDEYLQDNVLAGPYHPAFGQLVRSRLWRRALSNLGSPAQPLVVNPADLSDALGHRGENRAWLAQHGNLVRLSSDREVERGFLRICGQDLGIHELSSRGGLRG